MVRHVIAAWLGALVATGCSSGARNGEAKRTLPDRATAPVSIERARCAAPLGLDVVPVADDRSGSTVVMARVHGRLLAYIADEDESLVRILDVDREGPPKELETVGLPGRPGRILMLPGGRLAIPMADRAEVGVYTPAAVGDGLDLRCTLETPDEPVDLAETPDHETLLVVTDWSHALVAFDLNRGERRFETTLGRALFHTSSDSRISKDGRACASCHPNGRDDGLVWSTPGGPRQTPMLAGRLRDTAPYGWDGAGSDLSHHLDHTLARLEGDGVAPGERAALLRYIATLAGPIVHAGAPAETLGRGQAVFLTAGCASCHAAEGSWTDGQRHQVSSRAAADAVAAFDTPSLRFVGGTAPYFHDGRYSTLHELLTRSDGPMGAARTMPAEDLDALETFVRFL